MVFRIIISVLFISCLASISNASFGIIGDAGRATASSKSVRESMLRQKVFKTILPGDNLYSGSYSTVWAPWKNAGFSFDVVAIGNHNQGYKNEMSFFKMPDEFYSKVIDGARFIVLNSDNNRAGYTQAAWLNKELELAQESLIFLVYHHPSYTISTYHTWDEKKNFQLATRPQLWKHRSKITALIVGHDHLATLLHYNDLPVIVSGAVQEVRKDKPIDYTTAGVRVKTAWFFDTKPYWAKLTLESRQGRAQLDFVRAHDDETTCSMVLETGKAALLKSGSCQ